MPMDLSVWNPVDHPRDRNGRFRDKWGLSPRAKGIFARLISGMNARGGPMSFRNDAHVQSYLDGQSRRSRRSKQQQASLDYYLSPASEGRDAGWTDINSTLRAGSDDSPVIRHLDSTMEPLEHDLILTRVMGADAFGLRPEQLEDVEEWTGKLVTDQAYQSMNAGTPYPIQGPHVTLSVLAPRGTKAIIPGGNDRTVILDRDQPIRITHVVRDGQGGVYVYAAAMPSQTTGEPARALGRELSPQEKAPAIDATPEEMARRGLTPEGTPDANAPAPPGPEAQEADREQRLAQPNAPTPTNMQPARPQREGSATEQQRSAAAMAERVTNAIADGRDIEAQRRGALEYIENAPRGEDSKENRALDRLASRVRRARDREQMMGALDEYTEERGLRRTGAEPGDVVDFNPDTMEPLSRRNVVVGDPVRVISAGYEAGDGPDRQVLSRQRVTIDSDTDKATLRRLRQERAQRNGRTPPAGEAPAPAEAAPEAPSIPVRGGGRVNLETGEATGVPEPAAPARREPGQTNPPAIVESVRDGSVTRNRARGILAARDEELRTTRPGSPERAEINQAMRELDEMERSERREPAGPLPPVEQPARTPRKRAAKKAAPAAPDGEAAAPTPRKRAAKKASAPAAKPAAPSAPSGEKRTDYENMRVPELRAEAQRRGLPANSRTRRADLIDMLKGRNRDADAPPAPRKAAKRAAKKAAPAAATPEVTPLMRQDEASLDREMDRLTEVMTRAVENGATPRARNHHLDASLRRLRMEHNGDGSYTWHRGGSRGDVDVDPALDPLDDDFQLRLARRAAWQDTRIRDIANDENMSSASKARNIERVRQALRDTMMAPAAPRATPAKKAAAPAVRPPRTDGRMLPRDVQVGDIMERDAPSRRGGGGDATVARIERSGGNNGGYNFFDADGQPIASAANNGLIRNRRAGSAPAAKKAAPAAPARPPSDRNVVDLGDVSIGDTVHSPGLGNRRVADIKKDNSGNIILVDSQGRGLNPPGDSLIERVREAPSSRGAAPAAPTSPYEGQRVSALREQAAQRGVYVPAGTRREGIVDLLTRADSGERIPSREQIAGERRLARQRARDAERREQRRLDNERVNEANRIREEQDAAAEEAANARADAADAAERSLNHPDGLGQTDTDRLRRLAGEWDIPDAADLGRDELLEKLRAAGGLAPGVSNNTSLTRTELGRMSTPQLKTLAAQRNINTSELVTRSDYIGALASRYRSDSAPDLNTLNTEIAAILDPNAPGEWRARGERARDLLGSYLNGEYAGLQVEVTSVTQSGGSSGFDFSARIRDANGHEIGTTRRQIHFAGTDHMGRPTEPYVYNAYLQIARQHQGSGFAEEWNNNLFAWYKRSGIPKVKVSANIDVGGYAWATKGFNFASETTAGAMFDTLLRDMDAYDAGTLSPSRRRKLFGTATTDQIIAQVTAARALLARRSSGFGTPGYPSAFELSQLGRRSGQRGKSAKWLGKGLMLGSGWSGVLHL